MGPPSSCTRSRLIARTSLLVGVPLVGHRKPDLPVAALRAAAGRCHVDSSTWRHINTPCSAVDTAYAILSVHLQSIGGGPSTHVEPCSAGPRAARGPARHRHRR